MVFKNNKGKVIGIIGLILLVLVINQAFAVRQIGKTYTNKTVMINQWLTLCKAHSTTCSYEILGQGYLGSNIYLFKIGSASDGKVMFDGSMHGWEDAGTEIEYKFAKWVLESTDTRAKNILEKNRLYFIPIVNMDSGEFRQNSRIEKDGSVRSAAPYGVDLNRNFVTGWGESGSSDLNNDYDYRGPSAGSEPETKAVRKALEQYRPQIYVNTHMGGDKTYMRASYGDLENNIIERYKTLSQQTGVSYIYPFGGAGMGGSAPADAKAYGASAWLIEILHVNEIPDTLQQMLNTYYPPTFALFVAMCESVQTSTTPSATCGNGIKETGEECDDGNTVNTDSCLNTCKSAKCGDTYIWTGKETCESPNTNNNNKCTQATSSCSGTKQGTRDAYGNCNSVCGCVGDAYTYQCVKGTCGAACAVDTDCNDNNANTKDTCNLNTCGCLYQDLSLCGNGIKETGEECDDGNTVNTDSCLTTCKTAKCGDSYIWTGQETCELPNTNNNNKCTQATSSCSGTKQGTRDAYGNCNSACGCIQDSYTYKCVKGACGAACAVDTDCNDNNANTKDSCNVNTCGCLYQDISQCGNAKCDNGETCNSCSTDCGVCPIIENHWVEAEFADSIVSPIQKASDSSASSSKYIYSATTGTSGEAKISFTLANSGKYVVWGRVSATDETQNSFFVKIDSGSDNLWELGTTSSWDWQQVSNRNGLDPVVFDLQKGKHEMVLSKRESGSKIDKFLITSDLSYIPVGLGNAAENLQYCGDNKCNNDETCNSCSNDCGVCPVVPVCGDSQCNGNEDCNTCSTDCGQCHVDTGSGSSSGGSSKKSGGGGGSSGYVVPKTEIIENTTEEKTNQENNTAIQEAIAVSNEQQINEELTTASQEEFPSNLITGEVISTQNNSKGVNLLPLLIVSLVGILAYSFVKFDVVDKIKSINLNFNGNSRVINEWITFIKEYENEGLSLKEIKQALVSNHGFDEALIDLVLETYKGKEKKVVAEVDDTKSLWYNYFKECQKIGFSLNEIKDFLLAEKGYDKSLVNTLIQDYQRRGLYITDEN